MHFVKVEVTVVLLYCIVSRVGQEFWSSMHLLALIRMAGGRSVAMKVDADLSWYLKCILFVSSRESFHPDLTLSSLDHVH